jgi:hypothetical protein
MPTPLQVEEPPWYPAPTFRLGPAMVLTKARGRTAETPKEWAELARQKLETADAVNKAGQRQLAYDEYGYAVECTIKALIMRRKRLNRWPDYIERPHLYRHNLTALLKETGLFQKFCKERKTNRRLRLNWLTVKDWAPSRYDVERPSGRVVADMRQALLDPEDGILPWLNCH